VWTLDPRVSARSSPKFLRPLGIGTIRFKNGDPVKGFLVEGEAVKTAEDISHFGGLRAYLKSR
jgi:allophanate hydrolase